MPVDVVHIRTEEADVSQSVITELYASDRPIRFSSAPGRFVADLRFVTGADHLLDLLEPGRRQEHHVTTQDPVAVRDEHRCARTRLPRQFRPPQPCHPPARETRDRVIGDGVQPPFTPFAATVVVVAPGSRGGAGGAAGASREAPCTGAP